MTTSTPTATEQANYVGAVVSAGFLPGGPLHVPLSDLLTEAIAVAMEAAGIDMSRGSEADLAEWPRTSSAVLGQIANEITEAMVQTARRYFELPAEGLVSRS